MQILFTKRKVHALYIGLAIVSMLLAGVSHVRAQETSDQMSNQGRSEMMREAAVERLQGLREDQQNRFINLVRNASARMDAAVSRLMNIADRIEARMEMLDSEGYATSGAAEPLSDARAKLNEAKSRLDAVKGDAEDGLVSETPRERFTQARTEFRAVRDLIREAFILLREALAELRDSTIEQALNGQPATATVVNSANVTRSVIQ